MLDLYGKAGIAITDTRGRIELAREEGMQQGEQQGRLKGRLKGQAELFLELIGERFGSVPDWVRTKLAQADPETLKGWSRKMFRAATLEEIFQ